MLNCCFLNSAFPVFYFIFFNLYCSKRLFKAFLFQVAPRITPFAFEDNPVHEGHFIQINCLVSDGDLPIKINWKLNDLNVEQYDGITSTSIGKRSSMLTIESVTYSNAGNYTCVAKNRAGESTHLAVLHVNGY